VGYVIWGRRTDWHPGEKDRINVMVTITSEARAHALNKGGSLFLEYIVLNSGCCIPYQPGPAVKLGKPYNADVYRMESIDGLTVFIPRDLSEVPLIIKVSSFLGMSRLVVEGWRHA